MAGGGCEQLGEMRRGCGGWRRKRWCQGGGCWRLWWCGGVGMTGRRRGAHQVPAAAEHNSSHGQCIYPSSSRMYTLLGHTTHPAKHLSMPCPDACTKQCMYVDVMSGASSCVFTESHPPPCHAHARRPTRGRTSRRDSNDSARSGYMGK
ncbi:hypothetical protein ABW21_db0201359 [Orbilia brochopaga]|nr:hypothetical protein ABW21_db0201359 [Drechslerella brochopaga]